jgi:hypothetical protein
MFSQKVPNKRPVRISLTGLIIISKSDYLTSTSAAAPFNLVAISSALALLQV